MRTTTSNIGIETVSVTPWGVMVVGNKEFADWTRGGVRLSKLRNADGNQVFVFSQGEGPAAVPSGKSYRWTRAWSALQERGPMRDFAATKPVNLKLTDDLKLEIELPPVTKCREYKARRTRVDGQLSVDAVLKTHSASAPAPEMSPQDQVMHDLKEAVRTLNTCKELIGETCEFRVLEDGRLRVVVGYE